MGTITNKNDHAGVVERLMRGHQEHMESAYIEEGRRLVKPELFETWKDWVKKNVGMAPGQRLFGLMIEVMKCLDKPDGTPEKAVMVLNKRYERVDQNGMESVGWILNFLFNFYKDPEKVKELARCVDDWSYMLIIYNDRMKMHISKKVR
jgi:hypothetical protein